MKINLVKNNVLMMSQIMIFSFLMFVPNSYANNIKIEVKRVSNLPIHAYERESSIANIISIIGGKGLKNKHGKSRNFLVRGKENFTSKLMNYYLFPNYHKKEKASYELRASIERTERILALVKAIKKRNNKPIFIVGFSRGSVDTGKFAKIYPEQISGIVVASGVYTNFSRKAENYSMELIIGENLQAPILIVHHEDDNCIATPFSNAKKFFLGLKAPSKMLLSYSDGLTSGGECGPFHHHGFEGMEEKVVEDIANWIIKMSRAD